MGKQHEKNNSIINNSDDFGRKFRDGNGGSSRPQ